LQQLAPPQMLYAEPANTFVAKFVGSPPMNIIAGSIAEDVFRCASGTLEVHGNWLGDVQLGFRPEAVSLADPTTPGAQLRAQVYAVEPLGNELIVAFEVGTAIIHARLAADTAIQVGQNCGLRIEPAKLHLFDPTDGTRITGASKPTTDNLATQREMA
jgi:ABC-type sugar transport system ATPase subunit